MHIFNTHCTTAHNSTCSLLNIIPSKNFALLPPIWQLTNCSPLEINAWLTQRFQDSSDEGVCRLNLHPLKSSLMWGQKEIIRSKVGAVCRMCRDFPVPVLLQTVDVMTVMRCHIMWRKMMTPFCNRCDLLNGGQATHYHATQQHNMCH